MVLCMIWLGKKSDLLMVKICPVRDAHHNFQIKNYFSLGLWLIYFYSHTKYMYNKTFPQKSAVWAKLTKSVRRVRDKTSRTGQAGFRLKFENLLIFV